MNNSTLKVTCSMMDFCSWVCRWKVCGLSSYETHTHTEEITWVSLDKSLCQMHTWKRPKKGGVRCLVWFMMKCVAGWFCLILKTSVWERWCLAFWVVISVVITAGRGECALSLSLSVVTAHVMMMMSWWDVFVFSVKEGDADGLQQDFGLYSYQLMKAIRIMEERFGITAPILFLRGSVSQHFTQFFIWKLWRSFLCLMLCWCQNSQRVPDRYRKHSHFGIGKDFSECWWKALGRELIAEQYLTEATGHNKFATLCKLTAKVLWMISVWRSEAKLNYWPTDASPSFTFIRNTRLCCYKCVCLWMMCVNVYVSGQILAEWRWEWDTKKTSAATQQRSVHQSVCTTVKPSPVTSTHIYTSTNIIITHTCVM